MGEGAQFEGVVDLVTMQAVTYEGEQGENEVIGEIPEQFKAAAEEAALRCWKHFPCSATT